MTNTPFVGLRKVLGDGARYVGGGRPLADEGFCFPPGLVVRRAGSGRPRNHALDPRQCPEVVR